MNNFKVWDIVKLKPLEELKDNFDLLDQRYLDAIKKNQNVRFRITGISSILSGNYYIIDKNILNDGLACIHQNALRKVDKIRLKDKLFEM